jgi:dimethylargininase
MILDELPDYPDAYFVEDVAVVTPEIAALTNPGAETRIGEVEHIESALRQYRPIAQIQPPGTLDGGDVMMVDNHCYIGISARTNEAGAVQLGRLLEPYGYRWTPVPVGDGLHLKSSVNYIGKNTLLLTEAFAEREAFKDFNKILVDEGESYTANTLLVNDKLLAPKGFPRTKEKLIAAGFEVIELDTTEIQKMDGGLSCMSLRF